MANRLVSAMGGMSPNWGGGDPSDISSGGVNDILQGTGVSIPDQSQLKPLGPFENMSAMSGHPGLARGMDNAMIALAGMGPTGATAGENIGNVARGVMGIQPQRTAYMWQQLEAPLNYAKEVGGIEAQQAMAKMHTAMAGYYGDRGTAALQRNATQLEMERMKQEMLSGKEMQIQKDPTTGKDVVMRPTIGDDFKLGWEPTNIDPGAFKQGQHRQAFMTRWGNTLDAAYIGEHMASHYGGWDKIPDTLDLEGLKVFQAAAKVSPSAQRVGMTQGGATNRTELTQWDNDQRDMLKNLLPNPKLSATEQKEIEDSAVAKAPAGTTFTERRKLKSNAVDAELQRRSQQHDQIMRGFGSFMALPEDTQRQYGGLTGYLQSQGGMPNPSASATGAAPSGPASLGATISQLSELLKK